MKLVTDDGNEVAIKDLQSIIIGDTQKVLISLSDAEFISTPLNEIVGSFDAFFGEERWMLTSSKLYLEVKDE